MAFFNDCPTLSFILFIKCGRLQHFYSIAITIVALLSFGFNGRVDIIQVSVFLRGTEIVAMKIYRNTAAIVN